MNLLKRLFGRKKKPENKREQFFANPKMPRRGSIEESKSDNDWWLRNQQSGITDYSSPLYPDNSGNDIPQSEHSHHMEFGGGDFGGGGSSSDWSGPGYDSGSSGSSDSGSYDSGSSSDSSSSSSSD